MEVANIIEIQQIRKLLIKHPDLLSMFELLVLMCNNRLSNDEEIVDTMELEENIEPELTDTEEEETKSPNGE
tara:strand:+ start:1254 stop:1469 length:216 start_codon:yes stop_codon:yes gene_type:complete